MQFNKYIHTYIHTYILSLRLHTGYNNRTDFCPIPTAQRHPQEEQETTSRVHGSGEGIETSLICVLHALDRYCVGGCCVVISVAVEAMEELLLDVTHQVTVSEISAIHIHPMRHEG